MVTTDFIAAIEVSSSRLAGIAGRKNNDGSIEVLAYAREEASAFVHKGVIFNIDKAAQALVSLINRLETQLRNSIAKVYVGIGGQSLRTVRNAVNRSLEEESVISQELVDSICDENLEVPLADMIVLDVAPQEYRIDGVQHVDPVGVAGRQIVGQFLNIVARASLRSNLERSFEQAHVKMADLLIAPLAQARALLADSEMRAGCALVDLGAGTTTVSVYKNNLLRYLCVLPLGSGNVTRDITSLHLEEEEAERLKLAYGDALYEEPEGESPATCTLDEGRTLQLETLNNIVGARVEEILANVWNQLQLSGYEDQLFAGVVLTGEASRLKHVEEAFIRLSKVEKVKTVRDVRAPLHAPSDLLPPGEPVSTLLSLLQAGTENCCLQEAAPVRPAASPSNPTPPSPDSRPAEMLFGDDDELKRQEEAARQAKAKRDQEEKERRKKQDEERRRKQDEERRRKQDEKKKKGPGWFERTLGKISTDLFSDDPIG